MFGKGICTGHHGSCPVLQLSQFLSSFIQCYPRTGQISHYTRRCALHALDAAWAWDVLSQTPGRLSSCYLTNWVTDVEVNKNVQSKRAAIETQHIHSSSLSSDCAPPPKRPLKNPLLGASGVSTGVNSSPSISWSRNTDQVWAILFSNIR